MRSITLSRIAAPLVRVALAAAFILVPPSLLVPPAGADGLVVIRPTPELPDPVQLAVRNHLVKITIRNQVGEVEIDQTFRNPNGRQVEGEYLFPVPEGAAVSDFTLYVDGRPVHAQAMDASEALHIYEDLVRQSRDPALLEYAGREIFRARIFPFPAHGDRRVTLDYDQLVERQGGLYRFVYPLSTEKFSSAPLEHASVSILLETDRPVRNAYCPTHDVEIEYLDSRRVRVTWEESGTTPDRDLVLFYSLADEAMDLRLVPYRPDGSQDGYFMLLASVGADTKIPVLPKDVVFVIDRSGSMQGVKIDQARQALDYCLRNLNPDDRFNVIAFASAIDAFADRLQPVSRRSRSEALRFIEALEAGGGTNISEALAEALHARFDPERPAFLVFITDGMPTVGETDVENILEGIPSRGTHNQVRIFPFGVGYDVNAPFLDQLAIEHGGSPSYVRPTEDLQASIEGFYDRISRPVMTDLELEVNGVRFRDLEPAAIPDLFRGGQLVLFGRYHGSGAVEVSLSGRTAGRQRSFELSSELPYRESGNAFVARLWATRRVGSLLRHIRIYGEQAELVQEIKDLGLRFGIASPYTSFLVDETEGPVVYDAHGRTRDRDVPAPRPRGTIARAVDRIVGGLKGGREPSPHANASAPEAAVTWGGGRVIDLQSTSTKSSLSEQTGEAGFEMSKKVEELASARVDESPQSGAIRTAAGKTFRREGDLWRQLDCPEDVRTAQIRVGSREYFDLIKAHSEIGAILALGDHVIFELDGTWYEIVPEE
jgi:Ca-activated chloride channel family protein